MTPPTVTAPRRTRLRRIAVVGVVSSPLAVVVALAAWPSAPSGRSIGWTFHGFQGPGFDAMPAHSTIAEMRTVQAAAARTTVIPVNMDWWPGEECATTDSWLATPTITYTSSSVTITMHAKAGFDCGSFYDYWGTPVLVHLSEPLAGRLLLDGSKDPPVPRTWP